MAFVSNGKSRENVMSLGGIVSISFAFFVYRLLRFLICQFHHRNMVSLTIWKKNISLLQTSDPLITGIIFIMLG